MTCHVSGYVSSTNPMHYPHMLPNTPTNKGYLIGVGFRGSIADRGNIKRVPLYEEQGTCTFLLQRPSSCHYVFEVLNAV